MILANNVDIEILMVSLEESNFPVMEIRCKHEPIIYLFKERKEIAVEFLTNSRHSGHPEFIIKIPYKDLLLSLKKARDILMASETMLAFDFKYCHEIAVLLHDMYEEDIKNSSESKLKLAKDILISSKSKRITQSSQEIEVRMSDGFGIRFAKNGKFLTFLEPCNNIL